MKSESYNQQQTRHTYGLARLPGTNITFLPFFPQNVLVSKQKLRESYSFCNSAKSKFGDTPHCHLLQRPHLRSPCLTVDASDAEWRMQMHPGLESVECSHSALFSQVSVLANIAGWIVNYVFRWWWQMTGVNNASRPYKPEPSTLSSYSYITYMEWSQSCHDLAYTVNQKNVAVNWCQ